MILVRRTLGVAVFALVVQGSAVAVSRGTGKDFSPDPLYTGDWVVIIGEGGNAVTCAGSDADWSELIRLQRGDAAAEGGLSKLRKSGAVYEVVSGTEAIVTEPSHLVPGLKLKSGKHSGQVCFTDRTSVQRYRRYSPPYWFY
jgi:hypothetical protein